MSDFDIVAMSKDELGKKILYARNKWEMLCDSLGFDNHETVSVADVLKKLREEPTR